MNKLCYCTNELISETSNVIGYRCGVCFQPILVDTTQFKCDQNPEDCIYNDEYYGNYTVCKACYDEECESKDNLDLENKNKFILNKFASILSTIS